MSRSAGPTTVVLDFGYVLSREQPGDSVRRLEKLCGAEGEAFRLAYWRHRAAYDRGSLTGAEYWRAVAADLGGALADEPVAELIREDAASWADLRPEMVAWVRALGRAGIRTAILSNMPREVWAEIERRVDWLEACSEVTLSFEVGMVKPEPEIYRLCLSRLGADPASTVFVDDRPENVATAEALGMRAIRFESPAQLDGELQAAFDGALPPVPAGE